MVDYVLLEEYTKGISVLFVEDDVNIRKETYELLIDIFPFVDVSVDGEEGYNQYLNHSKEHNKHYDLVITDIKMPKLNGVDLSKKIYGINVNQEIIVLSAYPDSEYLIEFVNIGISQFIMKPIEINNFINVIFDISKKIHTDKNNILLNDYNVLKISENLLWNKKLKLLTKDETIIKLSKKELLFIELLLKIRNKIHSIDEVISCLWGDERYTSPEVSNLNNIISRLRKKVPELKIENVYGFGYKITLD